MLAVCVYRVLIVLSHGMFNISRNLRIRGGAFSLSGLRFTCTDSDIHKYLNVT